MPKLNQIVAIEKSVKSRVYGDVTDLHKSSQKAELFNGFSKNYRKKMRTAKTMRPNRRKSNSKRTN